MNPERLTEEDCRLLSQMRSDALFLLRSEGPLVKERGMAYARLLASFAALGFADGDVEDDYEYATET